MPRSSSQEPRKLRLVEPLPAGSPSSPADGRTPHDVALEIAEYIKGEGFMDIRVMDHDEYTAWRVGNEFGVSQVPSAAVFASGFDDWDITLSFELADKYPTMQLEAIMPSVLGVYEFVPVVIPKDVR